MEQNERPLSRKEASAFLTARGYQTATKSLEKLACVGGGPVFTKFGRRALYAPSDLLAWVAARSRRVRHTSELGEVDASSP